ncbi:LysR family transcriptional regulator [Labrenzia sp. PHM005]|uniref:LysR family transcriptional regulator n=1 Tax=Labrenzia sp. PHM005 TaxID=2590016 RepID=UPI001140776E|nr:LysR family transcriptional regulator [Labrenzia sp. PHM005]QDG75047.1 LysR family transcriptional regulator [Labrenzia sp. PHM005]
MAQSLPPLPAIRAFEAVSRHLSFTKAGEELGMTQAAVSYQIKLLEEKLGFAVFERKPRKIELTAKGAQLAEGVVDGFERLRTAFEDVRGTHANELVINSNTTFAMNWLGSRLFEFQMQNPDLAVRIVPYGPWEKPTFDCADVTISACFPPPEGSVTLPLVKAEFTPLVAPELAASIGGIHTLEDLLKIPIIDPGDPWWLMWFAAAGMPDPDLSRWPESRMGSQALEANRALAGQGAAILTPYFCRDALQSGRLIQPFELVCEHPNESWLLSYPPQNKNSRKIRLFCDWVVAELKKDGLALPAGSDGLAA